MGWRRWILSILVVVAGIVAAVLDVLDWPLVAVLCVAPAAYAVARQGIDEAEIGPISLDIFRRDDDER